jgi:OmpA-OmpF porin, OOP family
MWTSRIGIVAVVLVATAGTTAAARGGAGELQGELRQLGGDARSLDPGARRAVGQVRKLVGRPIRRPPPTPPTPEHGRTLRRKIGFRFGEHRLTKPAKHKLRRLAKRLEGRAVFEIKVTAHADWFGKPVYNFGLSLLRARRICEFLLQRLDGPSPGCTRDPRGEGDPVARNDRRDGSDNPTGRRLNRRAEIRVRAGP